MKNPLGGTKTDLVLKVFALLMGSFIPLANNRENEAALPAEEQNDSSLKSEPNLQHLLEMNFIQR